MKKLFTVFILTIALMAMYACKKNKAIQMEHFATDFQWVISNSNIGRAGTIDNSTQEIVFVRDTTRFYWTVK